MDSGGEREEKKKAALVLEVIRTNSAAMYLLKIILN